MIRLCEVGPRDGLQNEKILVSLENKFQLIQFLVEAGLKNIEVGAFVSPKRVPQMADSAQLIQKVLNDPNLKNSGVIFSALVPNEKGMEEALKVGIKKIAIFTAASETFNQKNINASIKGSIERFVPVVQMAQKNKIAVRGYISTAFVCPFEGEILARATQDVVDQLLDLGISEISIGDTVGKARPSQVQKLMESLLSQKNLHPEIFWMHFHDTYGATFATGTALPNIEAALDLGLTQFDASVAGLGGCPYAPGASGNVSTNELASEFAKRALETGVDLQKLDKIQGFIKKILIM